MKQGTIIVTFASIENKEDFLKDIKVEESSIFMNEENKVQLPLYFTAEAEDHNLVLSVEDGDPVEVEDEDFDLDDL
ncbi:hypothetical protein [Rubritalea marina]|uniref:hypothetical protein n=1 Tax=Rubritalea marina TaxID=361055 RepID=UPI000374A7BB|nr:hypothetical protein [Rubritalea marina]